MAVAWTLVSCTVDSRAELLVYEPFDYGDFAGNLAGSGDTSGDNASIGLTGDWSTSANNFYEPIGLEFSDLPVTGGRARLQDLDGVPW